MHSTRGGSLIVVLMTLGMFAGPVTAGPLDPPAPPASTYKTLDEVQPGVPLSSADFTSQIVIEESGVYYLTESVTFTGGNVNAIVVNADNVVIDFRGFTFTGPGNTVAGNPLAVASNFSNVQVRNGTIQSFPRGILLGNLGVVEDVTVRDGSLTGIVINGAGTVRRCTVTEYESAFGVRGIGIAGSATNRSLIEGCRVVGLKTTSANDAIGIAADNRTVVRGNLVENISTDEAANGSSIGIRAFGDSQVIDNVVRDIRASVLAETQNRNATGIQAFDSTVEGNSIENISSISAISYGIFGETAIIRGNTVRGIRNDTSGVIIGIAAGGESSCTIIENVIDQVVPSPTGVETRGMDLTAPSIVRDNTVWIGRVDGDPPVGTMTGIYARQGRAVIIGNQVWVLNESGSSRSIYFSSAIDRGYAGGNLTNIAIISDSGSSNTAGITPAPNLVF